MYLYLYLCTTKRLETTYQLQISITMSSGLQAVSESWVCTLSAKMPSATSQVYFIFQIMEYIHPLLLCCQRFAKHGSEDVHVFITRTFIPQVTTQRVSRANRRTNISPGAHNQPRACFATLLRGNKRDGGRKSFPYSIMTSFSINLQ